MKIRAPSIFYSVLIFGLMATVVYMAIRILFLFLLGGYNKVEMISAILLIMAELFILFHGIGYIVNIFKSRKKKEPLKVKVESGEPKVAILVAARHEPRQILESTFISIRNLNYKNKDIYFLDDSSEEKYRDEAE